MTSRHKPLSSRAVAGAGDMIADSNGSPEPAIQVIPEPLQPWRDLRGWDRIDIPLGHEEEFREFRVRLCLLL